ncbi:hypothetical protein GCM10023200_12760 [Actinomycetospora chlora]|uniref:Uncharacterized protein n=1 Tax=Actinomycetospora chlora TaxID=663608 RepID=A0ABP9AHT3_9PSEU
MSRHRREGVEEDAAPEVLVEDDAPTGPLDLSSVKVVVVPRPRQAPEAGEPLAPAVVSAVEQQWAALSPAERAWREWSDAPGGFVRPHTGPIPSPVPRPASAPAPRPEQEWGPWPPEQASDLPGVPSHALPAVATSGTWVEPERRPAGALVMSAIAVLVVLLVALGVALVQPSTFGLHAPPLFEISGEAGPGTSTGP